MSALDEGIAIGILREIGDPEPPISAFVLAELLGLRVDHESRITGARLVGRTIYLNQRASLERQHWLVAHELGHFALHRAGELQSERGADNIANALMLPRREFIADLRRTQWNLQMLRETHRYSAIEAIAKRICDVRDACISTWRHGRIRLRFCSAGTAMQLRRVTDLESELAARAAASLQTVRADVLALAVPVVCPKTGAVSVVTVADAEQLALELDCYRAKSA
jgi:hypothetical protein